MINRFVSLDTYDVRFPTSAELDGSDAMNPDPDYSAAYVVLRTDEPAGHEGHGFAFTIGRGNEVQSAAIAALRPYLVGQRVSDVLDDLGAAWRGVLAALAGLLMTGRLGSVAAAQGEGMIFTVFAAAVIDGVSMEGGKGTLFGALCGVLVLGLINNILTLAGVSAQWIQAIYGLIILIALVLARVTTGKAQD